MKIGIVSAHYMPEIGYQEVHLAKSYARIGHTVKVFTTNASVNLGGSIGQLSYRTGESKDPKYQYDILRLPAWSYKSKAYASSLKHEVQKFQPDVLVILGVAKVFPQPILNQEMHQKTKMVSLYGDAKEYLEKGSFKQNIKNFLHELGYATIKKRLYKKAVAYCDKIILNIPETEQIFNDFLNEDEKKIFQTKKVMLNLGYDPDEYYFDEKDRNEKRKALGIADDEVVVMTSTRINKRKHLEKIISLISKINDEGKKVKYILVGFLGDEYEQELKQFIQQQTHPNQFICFPFLNAKDIRKLYCAADAGIWLKAAISIQEAMGTGLPVILENKPSVNHLFTHGRQGWFFEKNHFDQTIMDVVDELLMKKKNRVELARENSATLSYDAIAQKILDVLTDKK